MTHGSIRTEAVAYLNFPLSYVITTSAGSGKAGKQKQYIFMEHVKSALYAAAKASGNMRVYQNFSKAKSRGAYKTVIIYGLEAVDIDEPHAFRSSVRLDFDTFAANEKIAPSYIEVLMERL